MARCILKVKCKKCGRVWSLDWQDMETNGANVCPDCGAIVPAKLWDKDIAKAARAVLDCNLELEKCKVRNGGPAFAINVIGMDG